MGNDGLDKVIEVMRFTLYYIFHVELGLYLVNIETNK